MLQTECVEDSEEIDLEKDMDQVESLLDYGCSINKEVVYRINDDESGIHLDAFSLGKFRFDVKDTIVYKPHGLGCRKKGAG